MLTHTHLIADASVLNAEVRGASQLNGVLNSILRRAGQLRCGLFGHYVLLRYEPRRLSLECTHCGYASPGWEIGPDR